MKLLRLFLLSLALGCGLTASAQTTDDLKTNVQATADKLARSNYDPADKSALLNAVSSFSLSSTLNAGANAKIQAAHKLGSTWSSSLVVEQQLGKTDEKATFYDFSKGVSPGTTITLSFQKKFWQPKLSDAGVEKLIAIQASYAAARKLDTTQVSYNDIRDKGTADEKKELQDIPLKMPVFLKFSFALTRSSFDYATDSVSLKKTTQDAFTPVLKVSMGMPTKGLNGFFALSYLYSNNYKPGNSSTFLMPFGTSGNLISKSIIFGAPKQEKDHHITAEYRHSFGGETPDLGINPMVTYGFSSKKLALEVPLYFIKGVTDKDKTPNGLQGGISLGYITDTNKFAAFKTGFGAQVLVSAPFSVFGDLFK